MARSHADAAETVDVTTARLDGLLLHVPSIKMMKVDLEGAELGAFQGGIDALAKTSAVIYEDNSRDRNVSASLTAFLQEQGFQVREIDGNNRLAVRVLDDLGRCLA
ncbi:FkbM family methyltransferase [Thermomonas sp. S9]|uniref:FkbM family methyltransferase n=1 Tax=Thermomonas sp. S9 TaxID=2885203 RepID=UPI00216B0BB1|nr:FkbM family methyltransferase [Thermomonas sp. S9]MCR6496043.1 FkbM family methyltransferase [Thermomonas sp. S9]